MHDDPSPIVTRGIFGTRAPPRKWQYQRHHTSCRCHLTTPISFLRHLFLAVLFLFVTSSFFLLFGFFPLKPISAQNFTYIKAMELCNCRKCSTHTWIDSSGTTQKGQLLSSRNKRKHQCNDYFQSTASIIHQKHKQASDLLMSTNDGSETEESNDDMSIHSDLEVQNNLTAWRHVLLYTSL
ncbi:hypothetical protein O181_034450 [Austropuccinia psidii MF-1]|uniref:Uncharacterized protein n=1 Tax=Austropuccinia psidii MF-1 TaxID=1389203 RepID=A0A9Q3D4Z4_9BASI|nr:hypothetical protein [Austropuccinia psidii MF-1]